MFADNEGAISSARHTRLNTQHHSTFLFFVSLIHVPYLPSSMKPAYPRTSHYSTYSYEGDEECGLSSILARLPMPSVTGVGTFSKMWGFTPIFSTTVGYIGLGLLKTVDLQVLYYMYFPEICHPVYKGLRFFYDYMCYCGEYNYSLS